MTKQKLAGDQEVQMDRRRSGNRRGGSADAVQASPAANPSRRKQPRRRQIDPTTCERDYNDAEIEFMQAIDAYKRTSGRMFPTCSEILEVIQSLGYRRLTTEELQMLNISREIESMTDDLETVSASAIDAGQ
jgi:hypothetical protein